MAAACTCSYEGKYGHLVWTFMFPCKMREYLPTIFDYLMLANVAPLFYGPCWAAMPMVRVHVPSVRYLPLNTGWFLHILSYGTILLHGKP